MRRGFRLSLALRIAKATGASSTAVHGPQPAHRGSAVWHPTVAGGMTVPAPYLSSLPRSPQAPPEPSHRISTIRRVAAPIVPRASPWWCEGNTLSSRPRNRARA